LTDFAFWHWYRHAWLYYFDTCMHACMQHHWDGEILELFFSCRKIETLQQKHILDWELIQSFYTIAAKLFAACETIVSQNYILIWGDMPMENFVTTHCVTKFSIGTWIWILLEFWNRADCFCSAIRDYLCICAYSYIYI
jgi:hypothetical protein